MPPVKKRKASPARKRNTKRGTKRATPRAATRRAQPKTEAEMSTFLMSKGVSAYLEECRGSQRTSKRVALGALAGMPSTTEDPAVVQKAILMLESRLATIDSPIKELKAMQRIADLRRALAALKDGGLDQNRQFFVQHGARFAAHHHLDYATFRGFGVPADALKEAGIRR